MSQLDIETARQKAEESPIAWFAVLERARQANDFELAAQALRRLKQLGVLITYKPSKAVGQEMAHA